MVDDFADAVAVVVVVVVVVAAADLLSVPHSFNLIFSAAMSGNVMSPAVRREYQNCTRLRHFFLST